MLIIYTSQRLRIFLVLINSLFPKRIIPDSFFTNEEIGFSFVDPNKEEFLRISSPRYLTNFHLNLSSHIICVIDLAGYRGTKVYNEYTMDEIDRYSSASPTTLKYRDIRNKIKGSESKVAKLLAINL